MGRNETIYNGSEECAGCGWLLTPVEAMYGGLCPTCRADSVRRLILNGMVPD